MNWYFPARSHSQMQTSIVRWLMRCRRRTMTPQVQVPSEENLLNSVNNLRVRYWMLIKGVNCNIKEPLTNACSEKTKSGALCFAPSWSINQSQNPFPRAEKHFNNLITFAMRPASPSAENRWFCWEWNKESTALRVKLKERKMKTNESSSLIIICIHFGAALVFTCGRDFSYFVISDFSLNLSMLCCL